MSVKSQCDIEKKMNEIKEGSSSSSESQFDNFDPELDIRSEFFNPLKALLSPETHVPTKNAPIYNNVAQYESAVKRQNAGESMVAPKVPHKSYRQEMELHQRRFLPHQEMVQGRGKNMRQRRNMLLRMSGEHQGPTNLLKQWKDEKKRIKIFTRNATTINGCVTGYIEAFDKHWNIVVYEASETWTRRKFHYCSVAAVPNDENNSAEQQLAECMRRLKSLNITLPSATVKSINRKQVECTRNVSKLLIRGEQIATIVLDTDNQSGNGNKIRSARN